MAKNIKVIKESPSGRNQEFVTPSGKEMDRPEFVQKIRDGKFPDYHVRVINGVSTPVSNPDKSEGNNLD